MNTPAIRFGIAAVVVVVLTTPAGANAPVGPVHDHERQQRERNRLRHQDQAHLATDGSDDPIPLPGGERRQHLLRERNS